MEQQRLRVDGAAPRYQPQHKEAEWAKPGCGTEETHARPPGMRELLKEALPGGIAHPTPAWKEKLVAPQCLELGHDGEQNHAQPLHMGELRTGWGPWRMLGCA